MSRSAASIVLITIGVLSGLSCSERRLEVTEPVLAPAASVETGLNEAVWVCKEAPSGSFDFAVTGQIVQPPPGNSMNIIDASPTIAAGSCTKVADAGNGNLITVTELPEPGYVFDRVELYYVPLKTKKLVPDPVDPVLYTPTVTRSYGDLGRYFVFYSEPAQIWPLTVAVEMREWPSGKFGVRVTVTDTQTGAPVEGAMVQAEILQGTWGNGSTQSRKGVTNADGVLGPGDVVPGSSVRISVPGAVPVEAGTTVLPAVSIVSITRFGTSIPLPPNNVDGTIDITIHLEVTTGASVAALRTHINNSKVCENSFSGGGGVTGDYICSVNTAEYAGTPGLDAQAVVPFRNGPGYQVLVEAISPTGTAVATAQSSSLTFNNKSFIVAAMKAPTNCTTGSFFVGASVWCEGAITADFLPVNFSAGADDAVNSITLTANTGATATDMAAGWSVTLQKASSPGASSIAGVEGVVSLLVNSNTVGGEAGPTCINPDPVLNPIGFCAVTTWVLGTGGLPSTALLVDNRAPTITLFDMTPGTLCPGTAAPGCYIGGSFAFTVRPGFFAHVDGGVGSPTAAFAAGLPGAEIPVTSGADLGNTATPLTYVVNATSRDKLGNQITRWAGVSPFAPTTSATSNSTQKFGVQNANPSLVLTTVADGSVNGLPASSWVTYASPAGFLVNPVRIKIERILPAGTKCHHPDTGAAISCTANGGFVADDGVFFFLTSGPIPAGYYRISVFVIDQAGNTSATQVIEALQDLSAPSSGGIAAPATIVGGSSVSFAAAMADNVDLGSLLPYVGYGPGTGFLAWPAQSIGTFGPGTLSPTYPGSVTINAFIRSVQTNDGAGLPSGVVFPATSMTYAIRDMAGQQLRHVIEPWTAAPNDGLCPPAAYPDPGSATQNCLTRQLDIAAAVAAPVGGIFPRAYSFGAAPASSCLVALSNCDFTGLNGANALHGLFVMQTPSNAVICNDPASANCPTLGNNATTTTLTVTLTGPVSAFVSPFSEVQFRYVLSGFPDQYIGSAGPPSIADNTTTNTRTVTYTMVWDASAPKVRPAGIGTAYTVYALGRNAAGDALMSTTLTPITVEGN